MQNNKNEGFAKANNQGFRIANGKYILILNPDTVIKDNSIQVMIDVLDKNPDIGMVGPRIVDQYGNITPPCRRRDLSIRSLILKQFLIEKVFFYVINRFKFLKNLSEKKYYRSELVPCIQGACMLVRKNELQEIGFFDESIPMYLDDIDLCYRYNREKKRIYYCSEAEIIHYGGSSTKKSENPKLLDLLVYKSTDAFFLKYRSYRLVFFHHIILFFASILFLLIDILLLPVVLFKREFVLQLIPKHFFMLWYAVSGALYVPNFSSYFSNRDST